MLPYFFLLLVSGVFPLLIYKNRNQVPVSDYNGIVQKREQTTIFIFFIGLFILLALRDITVGRDLYQYKNIFERCYHTSFKSLPNLAFELGYTIYNKLISFLTRDYRLFLIITGIITLLPIYKLYHREAKYSFLLILLFINMPCFLIIFSGLRQAIAISIGVLAFMAIENKKYVISVLLIVLATYFHASAFVLFLLYPLFFFKIKSKYLLYIVPIMFIIYIFRVPLFLMILNFVPARYVEFYGDLEQTGAYGMLLLFLMFSVFSFVVLDEEVMSEKDFFFRNILLVATIFQFFVPIHAMIQRTSYYFLIFVPMSIISVVQSPKKWLKNVSDTAVVVLSVFFAVYFFYNGFFSTDNLLDVFPYKFYWSGQGW